MPLLLALVLSAMPVKKIVVMPLEGQWSSSIARAIGGVVSDGSCTQFSCFKTVAKDMGATQYVVGTVVRYDKRVYLALRLHDVAVYAPVAKASRDWLETAPAEPELSAIALALLKDAAPKTPELVTTTFDRSLAPSPVRAVGWSLIGAGLAGIATGAVLFAVGQASLPGLRTSVAQYNDQQLRSSDDFSRLQAQERSVTGVLVSGYVIGAASLPALVIGMVQVLQTPAL